MIAIIRRIKTKVLSTTYRYESSFWFNQRPILSVHFVVQSAGVTQVVAEFKNWKSTIRIKNVIFFEEDNCN